VKIQTKSAEIWTKSLKTFRKIPENLGKLL